MTTETNAAPGPVGISPGRAACETFWSAIDAGPSIQEPGAAWNWAISQKATGAWEAAAKAAASAAGRERDEARAELARIQAAAQHLGHLVTGMARSMEAARIEMLQNGPEKAMQWILNSIPDVDDNDPEDQWNGTESADEWFDRTREPTP